MDCPVLAKPISQQVLKKLNASLEGVDIVVHQDALLDIVEKIQKFTNDVIKNAKHFKFLGKSTSGKPLNLATSIVFHKIL